MSADSWAAFQERVAWDIGVVSPTVHVDRALSVGAWNGVAEDSCSWVFELHPCWTQELRERLAVWAHDFQQDAIALTLGTTELIEREES